MSFAIIETGGKQYKVSASKILEIEIQKKLSSDQPTIPTTLGQEIKTNIFFRCNDPEIRHTLGLKDSSEAKVFSKLRDLKDSF